MELEEKKKILNMELEEKKIYFVPSPHINYYHSYRGDSRGESGFGQDIRILEEILDQLDTIEERGLCNCVARMTWDYGDTFWSIQLQKEYQEDVLNRIIERCKKGKDEVLIGSWGNVGQPFLDTEEFRNDHEWHLENSMGIGLKQLFPSRIAPYARTQETMFTQGMIELYKQLGIEGIAMYYSAFPFDVSRPFLNPRLTWNQMYNPIKFKSAVTDASILMIPMYSFGDILDYLSIKKWFELIRKKQESGEIKGHALLFLNFDMDDDTWVGIKLPKFLRWMPNSRGLIELAEAVDRYDYVEFGNLLDVVPKLKIQNETILRQDAADGSFNGFYNWAQKYNNTKFWTVGQRARWLKCISDNLACNNLPEKVISQINRNIRKGDDLSETYIKNKLLFASTTNFGMSMPFLHENRHKTAMIYGIKAHIAAEKAVNIAIKEMLNSTFNESSSKDFFMIVAPIINRGISENEKKPINSPIIIKTKIPLDLANVIQNNKKELKFGIAPPEDFLWSLYNDGHSKFGLTLEAILPESMFERSKILKTVLTTKPFQDSQKMQKSSLKASSNILMNEFIILKFNDNGKVISFKHENKEYGCYNFLDSSVVYGKKRKGKRYSSKKDKILVIRDGSDGFSASIKIVSEFEIVPNAKVYAEKTLIIYSGISKLFINVSMTLPNIEGEIISEDSASSVIEQYDVKWQEIMPCELRPIILGNKTPLRIWKHNFLGCTSYFDLDMRDVDSKNKNIDCLVANISDGWMALTNQREGVLIGFNSIKAANFAFSPIKIRDKGFGDVRKKGQQIRINPFGTYYGKMLHYWTHGTGFAQKFATKVSTTFRSTAPSFSGKKISFKLIIAPYLGDKPPESIISFANHFSFPPLIVIGRKDDSNIIENYSKYGIIANQLIKEFGIEDVIDLSYLEWVKLVNKDFNPNKDEIMPFLPKMGIGTNLRLFIDGIRGR